MADSDIEISLGGNAESAVFVHENSVDNEPEMKAQGAGDDDVATSCVSSSNESDHGDDMEGNENNTGEDNDENPNEQVKTRQSVFGCLCDSFKYLYSSALLVFAVVVVMAAIFQDQTVGTAERGVPPVAAFFVFWFLIVWLAMMEGGQGALVGLQPIDKSLYAESHPKALKNTTLAHKGDNMERFIVGRQFLVVLVLFVTNIMASPIKNASVLGFSNLMNEIFLYSGLSVSLITIMIGQLTAQVNAASCMLDFINNYFMLFTIYVSLFIEFSGLLHCVYLVQIMFSVITKKPIESKEPPRSALQHAFFWFRVLMSLVILGFCFAVTLAALFQGKTAMWDSVPAGASIVMFFLLMCFVGLMEGMQIALFSVVNLDEEELSHHRVAAANCKLTFTGHNLQAFLIGRQICVTVCTFVIARITSLNVETGTGENIFGVSDGLQSFFNTGLLGAVITTIVASLAWRVVASSFPLAFMSNPLIYLIIRLCLFLEMTGICSAAWLLAFVQKRVARYQPDDVYIGTAKERESAVKQGEGEEIGVDNDLALEEQNRAAQGETAQDTASAMDTKQDKDEAGDEEPTDDLEDDLELGRVWSTASGHIGRATRWR